MLVSYGKMSASQVQDLVAVLEKQKGALVTVSPAAYNVCMVKQDGEKILMFIALKITDGYLVRAKQGLIATK